MALINGTSYSFSQIKLVFANVVMTGIQEVTYVGERDVTGNMGTGNRPNSVGFGPIDSTATLALSMNEVEKIRDAVKLAGFPSGTLLEFPLFDIIVVYNNAQKIVKHTLKNCAFKKDEAGGSLGDTEITGAYDLFVSQIFY